MKLICPECRLENDPLRIYCHDCGTRLDRSGLSQQKSKEEDPKAIQRRVAAMFNPRGALFRRRFFQGSKFVLGAVILAVIVQMFRPPPDVPERPKVSMFPSPIGMDLENAATNPRAAAPLQYSDEQVNSYLVYALKSKQAALSKYLKFERAIVGFEEGYSRLTIQRSLYGVSLFTTISCEASIQDGNIVPVIRGGHIGRMPVHPAVMKFSGILFTDVRAALERERKLIAKLGSIEFHPHAVVFTPKPPQT